MTMKLTGPKLVLVSELKTPTFVRTTINQDHVLYLAELYESGQKIKTIIINKNMEIIDGRHRLEAMLLLGVKETQALVSDAVSMEEMLVEAMRANLDGPLPPKPEDITFVISQLITQGISKVKIRESMPFPKAMLNKHIHIAEQRLRRKQISDAVEAIVREGISIPKAAEAFNVKVEEIKEILMSRKANTETINTVLSSLEIRVRSLSQRVSATSKQIITGIQSGDFSKKDADKYLQRIKQATQRMTRTAENVSVRVRAAMDGKLPIEVEGEE